MIWARTRTSYIYHKVNYFAGKDFVGVMCRRTPIRWHLLIKTKIKGQTCPKCCNRKKGK